MKNNMSIVKNEIMLMKKDLEVKMSSMESQFINLNITLQMTINTGMIKQENDNNKWDDHKSVPFPKTQGNESLNSIFMIIFDILAL